MKYLKIIDEWIVKKAVNILNKSSENREEKRTGEIRSFLTGKIEGASEDLSEVTYFTCLKVLSESIGKLSINLKDKENNNFELDKYLLTAPVDLKDLKICITCDIEYILV